MLFTLNTRAAGHFKIYTEDNYGDLVLLSQTKNLITNSGLNNVAQKVWADCFTHVMLGDGDTDPNDPTRTSLVSQVYAPSNTYPENPGSYSLGSWNPATGVTYRLGRSYKIDNNNTTPTVIKEIGTSDGTTMFSRAVLPSPVTIPPKKFIYVIYELKLETGNSTKVSTFDTETDGLGSDYEFPTINNLGIFNCGFALIGVDGVTFGKNFTAGEAILEPSCTKSNSMYLYRTTTAAGGGNTAFFNAKRSAFQLNPNGTLAQANTASSANAPTYARFGLGSSALYNENLSYYDEDTYRIAKHIIVAPPAIGTPQVIHGFVLSTKNSTTGLDTNGIHCMFDTPWNRPSDSFIKIYFEHNWSR